MMPRYLGVWGAGPRPSREVHCVHVCVHVYLCVCDKGGKEEGRERQPGEERLEVASRQCENGPSSVIPLLSSNTQAERTLSALEWPSVQPTVKERLSGCLTGELRVRPHAFAPLQAREGQAQGTIWHLGITLGSPARDT